MAQYRITLPGRITANQEPHTYVTHNQVSDYMIGQIQDIGEDVEIERLTWNSAGTLRWVPHRIERIVEDH